MGTSLEITQAPESVGEVLDNSFEEIKQTVEKEYPNAIIISGADTIQKSIRDQMGTLITEFPKKLEEVNLKDINTFTTQQRQNLTERMLKKAQILGETENPNISIRDTCFQRYKDIDSLLEKIINASTEKIKNSQ